MRFLLSNDDGIDAPGLKILADTFGRIGQVAVVAPDANRSGASHSITPHRTLRASDFGNGWFALDGTPADCVQVALRQLLPEPPDLVISGINEGANLADEVNYSGTVGAAREAVLLGVPALAVSLAGKAPWHFETAARMAVLVASQWRERSLPFETCLNINVPNGPIFAVKPPIVTRLGRRMVAMPPPRGRDGQPPPYWKAVEQPTGGRFMDDYQAVAAGHVSVTPLRFDATFDAIMEELALWPTFR
ncbi:MAG: 5'/3'-nucleotidase SurE [Magnetococcales bacterium]|nr:5'/3'-nucleotidase SurE [Magnetococcales bacterium]